MASISSRHNWHNVQREVDVHAFAYFYDHVSNWYMWWYHKICRMRFYLSLVVFIKLYIFELTTTNCPYIRCGGLLFYQCTRARAKKEISFPRPETDGLDGIIARARAISFISIRKRCEDFVTIRIMCYFRLNSLFTSRFVYLVLSCCICFYDDVTKWKCCPHIIGLLWRGPRVTGGCPWKLSAVMRNVPFLAVTLNTFI